jgi:hypothetical protein
MQEDFGAINDYSVALCKGKNLIASGQVYKFPFYSSCSGPAAIGPSLRKCSNRRANSRISVLCLPSSSCVADDDDDDEVYYARGPPAHRSCVAFSLASGIIRKIVHPCRDGHAGQGRFYACPWTIDIHV